VQFSHPSNYVSQELFWSFNFARNLVSCYNPAISSKFPIVKRWVQQISFTRSPKISRSKSRHLARASLWRNCIWPHIISRNEFSL
jgi:hypothetical protein